MKVAGFLKNDVSGEIIPGYFFDLSEVIIVKTSLLTFRKNFLH
jgi:hypothetical protein